MDSKAFVSDTDLKVNQPVTVSQKHTGDQEILAVD
jgi:hypothetical protein